MQIAIQALVQCKREFDRDLTISRANATYSLSGTPGIRGANINRKLTSSMSKDVHAPFIPLVRPGRNC
jgi:hypothetical protein